MTGARIASARGSHESLRARTSSVTPRSTVRPAPRITEPWRFAQTTSSGQDEERPAADPAAGRVDEEPQDAREERQRRRLRADRPAPRAGQDREQADDEGRAGRGASRPRGGGGEREREKDEEDAEQDHRAHPGERVRAVEDDLGEPLLVGPRLASAEDRDRLRVREAVLDDLATGHQRQPRVADDDRGGEDGEEHDPDDRDEQDREGARLERAAERAGCRRRLGGRGGGRPATSGRGSRGATALAGTSSPILVMSRWPCVTGRARWGRRRWSGSSQPPGGARGPCGAGAGPTEVGQPWLGTGSRGAWLEPDTWAVERGVRLQSDTRPFVRRRRGGREHRSMIARGSEILTGRWASVGFDPRRWPAPWRLTILRT